MNELMKYSLKNSGSIDADVSLVNEDVTSYTNLYDSVSLKSRVLNIAGITAAFALVIPDCSASELIKQESSTTELVKTYIDRSDVNDYVLVIPNTVSKPNFNFGDIVSDILSFQALKNDWDGYGAYALENLSGVNSISILENLGLELYGKLDDYYPNPNGTLSFEWRNQKSILALEIGNDEFTYFFKESLENKFYHNNLPFEKKNIKMLKEDLYRMFP